MKYTETFEALDDKDTMFFFKEFRTTLIVAIVTGTIGFVILLIDSQTYKSFQNLFWYVSAFILPLLIYFFAYMNFKLKISSKTKLVVRATVVNKKHILDVQPKIVDGMTEYEEHHLYYLYLEAQDEPIKVDEKMFHFFQKQDTMVLYHRDKESKVYRYEKNT